MTSEIICECGAIFNHEADVEWHETTDGQVWDKLRKEMDGNYVYVSNSEKTKIPEDARCDLCNELAHQTRLQVHGKRVPDWYVIDDWEKLIVRCVKSKKKQLCLIKSRFAKLINCGGLNSTRCSL